VCSSDLDLAKQCLELGACSYLNKPCDFVDLSLTIHKAATGAK
jgi:ActR/RegA family two-component response regulator